MNAPTYNFAYLDEQTKRMIRRAILKAIAIPGYRRRAGDGGDPGPDRQAQGHRPRLG